LILTILFSILASQYTYLSQQNIPLFITLYTLIQFFNNFGPNSTTFVLAGEVFPTRFRATAHGISAASGKAGAILAAHGFSLLKDIGGPGAFIPSLLWIFAGFMAVGAGFTLLLPETKVCFS
jgi:PHS family inorganic phosphate transporter-like MFS transporter